MSLYCEDGALADITPWRPMPEVKRGEPPPLPEPDRDRCRRCGRVSWQHRSQPPALADEIDRAIYAAAFVAAIRHDATPSAAVVSAETVVELHRSARSGR